MLFREPDVFVHVERDDILERYLSGFVQGDQLLVRRQRGRTRRQAQHERASGSLLLVDLPDDVMRRPTAGIFLCVFDNESHKFFGLSVCLFILHSDGASEHLDEHLDRLVFGHAELVVKLRRVLRTLFGALPELARVAAREGHDVLL